MGGSKFHNVFVILIVNYESFTKIIPIKIQSLGNNFGNLAADDGDPMKNVPTNIYSAI